ncbi:hypothetical protein PSN45_001776 [Yamadazyma tenuis]|uniref:p-loop containing nucleoside triphosphate hydrolase protein n=1 Tax=Candida tenuis (strain ATCC 10573 / BCRC 21748 / CBS 615 / JCM 9827 / NBRC 10315 / NRRL Y-1498 / VKM Y-70) TaxID=590646 RepID=G3BE62_CANTC|nr:P-loop containing nucleoside triphosphate hydrolase protein [Yamadazyma tenuis ATCC 10573]EGV60466.1 P-loop containing nucleoside triphosphate hydrolase protein [Yamadazyma tenuis ATCC 10573]WEJ94292.1 hypothetical protein PSN45_001776 [Yamadazyma tenuis]
MILWSQAKCLVRFKDCVLKDNLKSTSFIFKNPITDLEIYQSNTQDLPCKIGVIGHRKTEFLNALAMKYIAVPPLSRTYPLMAELKEYDQIQYLNFKESSGLDKVYLSARYESYAYKGKLEMSDDVNSVKNYIVGSNNYNSNQSSVSEAEVNRVIDLFNLSHLRDKWVNSLSNGQLRRARIAKSVLHKPKLLIIDDPFLGLDPVQTQLVSNSLNDVVDEFNMAIVLGLRFQDKVPEWIGHLTEVDESGVLFNGPREEVALKVSKNIKETEIPQDRKLNLLKISNSDLSDNDTPHVEFNNASVIYKDVPVLANFNWQIPRGTSWRILGENGTGKTTILSLITADHPQSWRSVLSVEGVLRKTGSGVTFFDVNNKIGISSPELHSLVPSTKTMNEIIKNGLVKDIGNSNFQFSGERYELPNNKIEALFQKPFVVDVLEQHGNTPFHSLSITLQKVTLFLRALIKDPELIILDEAFSCMDNVDLLKACHGVLRDEFPDSTILSIGHIEWELPDYDYVIKLVGDDNRSYQLFKAVAKD